MSWFEVDRGGLAKLLERRGKGWILAELLQNAWDAPGVQEVSMSLSPIPGRPLATLLIEDDSPEGFSNLSHAFTLFSESIKKSDPNLRGRFNLGEKLVLALCDEAEIASTTGTIAFTKDGRKEYPRRKRSTGTSFAASIQMTRNEVRQAIEMVSGFLAPVGIKTVVNGEPLRPRIPLRTFDWPLDTEVAGADGVLRRTKRTTRVSIFEPPEGTPARIYELGIPIVETGDRYDVDIAQKVPLSLERDSVTPGYLRDVRVGVLNHAVDLVAVEDAATPWIGDALEDGAISPDVVRELVKTRFGEKVVSYDPSDKEANDIAASRGYRVVHGGTFSAAQWGAIRNSEAMLPAGRVTPTPKPFSDNGPPAEFVEPTPSMTAFADLVIEVARRTLEIEIEVVFLKRFNATAAYGGRRMSFNVGQLGKAWFEGPLRAEQIDLIIHELGHEKASNHFSREYNDALSQLGARVAMLALSSPHVFDLDNYMPEPETEADAIASFRP